MTFAWTSHRFVSGVLALDVANSVILRADPARRTDRFAVPAQLAAFPTAASELCGERERLGPFIPVPAAAVGRFLVLREAIDAFFRAEADDGDDSRLAALLEAIAPVLRDAGGARSRLDAATAHSALLLIAGEERRRLKTCSSCGWLFVDRSKNRSRVWCDMAVCGNRAKARRHYEKLKDAQP